MLHNFCFVAKFDPAFSSEKPLLSSCSGYQWLEHEDPKMGRGMESCIHVLLQTPNAQSSALKDWANRSNQFWSVENWGAVAKKEMAEIAPLAAKSRKIFCSCKHNFPSKYSK